MKLIRTDEGMIIKPDEGYIVRTTTVSKYDGPTDTNKTAEINWTWGWRWNKNEGRWGKQCCQQLFRGYEWFEAEDDELPTVKPLKIDNGPDLS